jgi:hypothetical protein
MRRVSLVIGTAVLVAAPAAPAQAATVIGQTAPSSDCSPSATYGQVQISTGGPPSYTVPFDGTITSFSAAAPGGGAFTKLLVLQPVSGSTFNVVAKSDFGTFSGAGVQTFPANIPVKAGQVIGQYGVICAIDGTLPGDSFAYFNGAEPATGASQDFPVPSLPPSRIDISATIEPPTTTTGQRAAAKKRCKKKFKHNKAKRKKCLKRAKKLPV